MNENDQLEKLGKAEIDESEIFPEQDLTEVLEPDDAEINEATGNEGASMERWYHTAAVVIWPAENDLNMRANDQQQSMNMLQNWMKQLIDGHGQVREDGS